MNQILGSGWGALVWKEWRQQRLAALLLGLFCLLGYTGYSGFYRWEPEPSALLVLLVLVALCLGTSAFAGETDDQTARFLDALPLPTWQTLTGKYLMAGVLAVLCLGPTLLFYGALALADERIYPPRLLAGAPEAFLLATGTIALTGALTRQGLRGMGTLLASAALGASTLVLVGWTNRLGWRVCRAFVHEQGFYLALWAVTHVWLLCTWLWRRRSQPTWRSTVGWAALVLLVPAGPAAALLVYGEVYRQAWSPFGRWHQPTYAQATVSPDGRTIALWASRRSSIGGVKSAIWLVDVASGRMRRVGSPWQRFRLSLPSGSRVEWSRDGRELQVFGNPTKKLANLPPDTDIGAVEQWTIRVDDGAIEKTTGERESRWISCLADGTKAAYTPTAWEFTDGTTGEVRRCLHPPAGYQVNRQSGRTRWFQYDHARLAVAFDLSPGGIATCHVWEASPGLAQAERRELSLRLVFFSVPPYPLAVSPDGNWLLLSVREPNRHPMWVASLVDGTCRPVEPAGESRSVTPFFTADSRLLVVQRLDRLDALEMATGHWRTPIPLSFPDQPVSQLVIQPFPDNPHLLVANGMKTISVLDLEQGTATAVFAPPIQHHDRTREVGVLWAGQDRLLIEHHYPYQLWTVNADGSGSRQVLP